MSRAIYMIDDNVHKQEWFLQILASVNSRRPNLPPYCAGMGDDAKEAQQRSQDPDFIFDHALADRDGIYLVDLGIVTSHDQRRLIERLESSSDPIHTKAAAEYAVVKRQTDPLGDAARDYPIALGVLLCARLARRSTMLVSTDVASRHVDAVREADLATVAQAGFPITRFADDANRAVRLAQWVAAIEALLGTLEHLRSATSKWFEKGLVSGWNSYAHDGLPHDLPAEIDLQGHRSTVANAFRWAWEPDPGWWSDATDVRALHACLKQSVGRHAAWMGAEPGHNLCLGGAYLLLLTAIAEKFAGDVSRFTGVTWAHFLVSNQPAPFFPKQSSRDAAQSVRLLLEFFRAVRDLKGTGALAFDRFDGPTPGRAYFRVHLAWSSEELAECARSLRDEYVAPAVQGASLQLLTGKTVPLFLRLVLSMQARASGWGAIGTISVDDDGWLKVGR